MNNVKGKINTFWPSYIGEFQNENHNSIKKNFGSQYLEDENRIFIPKEGKLLIWPSHLIHGSHPYKGEKNRTIISINSSINLA